MEVHFHSNGNVYSSVETDFYMLMSLAVETDFHLISNVWRLVSGCAVSVEQTVVTTIEVECDINTVDHRA